MNRVPKPMFIAGLILGCLLCLTIIPLIRISIHKMIWNLREPDEYYMTLFIYDYGGAAQSRICVQNGTIVSTKTTEGESGLPVFRPWEQQSVMDMIFARSRDCSGILNCTSAFASYYHYPIRVSYFNEYTIEITDFATQCPNE